MRPTASSSFRPRSSTVLILTGVRPTAAAAARPANTSCRRSLPVIRANLDRSRVSREMLTRSRPADLRSAAQLARPTPLVVIVVCGRSPDAVRSALVAARMRSRPRRSRGSPPVSRTWVTPRSRTAMVISRITSSSVSSRWAGRQGSPSGGMQYVQRSEQRSVRLTRRSVPTRPKPSTSPASAARDASGVTIARSLTREGYPRGSLVALAGRELGLRRPLGFGHGCTRLLRRSRVPGVNEPASAGPGAAAGGAVSVAEEIRRRSPWPDQVARPSARPLETASRAGDAPRPFGASPAAQGAQADAATPVAGRRAFADPIRWR